MTRRRRRRARRRRASWAPSTPRGGRRGSRSWGPSASQRGPTWRAPRWLRVSAARRAAACSASFATCCMRCARARGVERPTGPVACSADFVQLLAPTALLSEELGYGSFVAAMARTLTQGVDGEDDEGAEGAEEAEDAAAPPPEEERGDDPRERARRLQQRRRHACGAARRADRRRSG